MGISCVYYQWRTVNAYELRKVEDVDKFTKSNL